MGGVALSTDLYELTMMAGYHAAGLMAPATFELYVRELPVNRSFLVAAGLEQALEYLESLRFSSEDIEHLRSLPNLQLVRREFFEEYLPHFQFTGEVWALEEGTPVFPPEPLLRVTAPLPEAQLVETALLAQIAFQTSVASRAARIVHAASDVRSWNSAGAGRTASRRACWLRVPPFSVAVSRPRTSRRVGGSASPSPARWRTPGSWHSRMSVQHFVTMPRSSAIVL